jgi:ATP-dependent Clp protease ATP-binding subunit ClpC
MSDYSTVLYIIGGVLILVSVGMSFRGGGGLGEFFKKFIPTGGSGKGSGGAYLTNVSQLIEEGHIDPVIGRDEEIMRLTQILSRRRKNNVILVGEPGVGKTAIAEGLAIHILEGSVPDVLKGKRVEILNVAEILGGTKYRGEFEKRVRVLVQHIRSSNRGIILFIDEIHTIMQTKGAEGSVNLADILKPALARGELQLIGATTLKEYEQYIAPDDSLERRFQPLMVDEPSVDEAISILKGLREKYEQYHNVKFTDEAIDAAVRLSKEYIKERKLPDKAIDVMDEAGAMVHVYTDVPHQPSGVLFCAADNAVGGHDTEMKAKKKEIKKLSKKVGRLKDKDKITEVKVAIAAHVDEMQRPSSSPTKDIPIVTKEHIQHVIAEWSGMKDKDVV